jgi:chitin disaccharide deacetylase
MLIINADDWGRSKAATNQSLACYEVGRISSTSVMVFMEDSERGADLAKRAGIDTGLHLNFTESFNGASVPPATRVQQERIRRFLRKSKYALLLYHPFLRAEFSSVFQAQYQEFLRLFGRPPSHFDGHQHMHLCTNMMMDRIIPANTKVRRSFSFHPSEKGVMNRCYRRCVDRWLAQRHMVTDYFFALSQHLTLERLEGIMQLTRESRVELMTHPAVPAEFAALLSDGFLQCIRKAEVGSYSLLGPCKP